MAKKLVNETVKDGMNILDVGPGECEILNHIYTKKGNKVSLNALDRHESVLNKTPPNTKLIKQDLNILRDYYDGIGKLQIEDKSFDLIILTELIEHISYPQIFISEISRILKTSGNLIITTPNVHMIGNRLATLLGKDKIFINSGAEGYITRLNFDQYGHLCHYTFESLTEMLSPYFNIKKIVGAGFHVPILRYFQPLFCRIFPKLSSNICLVATKKNNTGDIKTYLCPIIDAPQLILHDNRCIAVQVHSKTCHKCKFFHKDFLYRFDKRKNDNYIPKYD